MTSESAAASGSLSRPRRYYTSASAQVGGMLAAKLAWYYRPGECLPSETVLAEHYQVSRPTLRKAMAKMEKLGRAYSRKGSGWYVAEDAPRRTGRTITVICEDVPSESFWFVGPRQTRQLNGIRRALSESGYDLTIQLIHPRMREQVGDWSRVRWPDLLDFRNTCGLIVFWRFGHRHLHVVDTLREFAPLVSEGAGTDAGRGEVQMDVATGVFESIRHLLQEGHQRVAYVGSGPRPPLNQQRDTAIRLAAQSASSGSSLRCRRFEPAEVSEAEGARLADAVLDADESITAAHVCARTLGEGFYRRLVERGVRVPHDFSLVVELEDAREPESFPADATRVAYDYERLGERHAELLMKIVADPRAPHHVDPVPTALIEGSTTGPSRSREHVSRHHPESGA